MVDTNPPNTSPQRIPADIERALDAQRSRLFDAQALVEVTIAGLRDHFGGDWPGGVPMFDRVLVQALRIIDNVAGEIQGEALIQAAAKEAVDE